MALAVSKLDLTSIGSPANKTLKAAFVDAKGTTVELGNVPVTSGAATVNLAVPATAAPGTATLVLTAVESGTTVKALVTVAESEPNPPQCTAPTKPGKWYDFVGWLRYAVAWLEYQRCLRG
jgi:5'-nucleotidase